MWEKKSIDETIKYFSTDIQNGLTKDQVQKRLTENGPNILKSNTNNSIVKAIISELKDPMIYILLVTAIISSIIGEFTDTLVILIVIIINTTISTIQSSKASKALDSLKKLANPKATVKRNGSIISINSENIVIGDIVLIEAGNYIPADIRLIETATLKIDESTFTGESIPAEKDSKIIIADKSHNTIADRSNMAYMSTLATYGRGVGIVIATGMNTQIGSIFKMIENSKENITPLQQTLKKLSKSLGIISIIICLLIFLIGTFQKRNMIEMLLISLSLAVAAIPEGLPAIVSIVLAFGVQKMANHNAIVKKLSSVETLGCVNIICTDKTGTLTQNKMTVTKFFSNDTFHEKIDTNIFEDKLLLNCMVLCNDATSDEFSKTGDPTEIALLDVGIKYNIKKNQLNSEYQRINELPFDSERKLMSTINKNNQSYIVYTKGAIDSLIKICSTISLNGTITVLTKEMKTNIINYSNTMSDDALRVLGFAYKRIFSKEIQIENIETDLVFIGLVGMIDPPRLEVKDSIKFCKEASITPIMITGDHKNTAYAIASELGIAQDINECISGQEINNINEQDFNNLITKFKVFARVSPEHKVKIVNGFKSHDNIVSMTGDGVNDAPSLKAADIGISMGITGTDVAKNASDIILTDDNFATIVNAIKEGRHIFNNIRKSIIFLLSCNLGEIITLLFPILINMNTPLSPIHILWINLITDSFPALALGIDPIDNNLLNEKPRKTSDSIFKHNVVFLVSNGLLIATVTLVGFKYALSIYETSLIHAQTIAFAVLSISQLFFSLTIRNKNKSIFSIGILSNQYLLISILIGVLLQCLIITIPALGSIFKVYYLSSTDWLIVLVLSLIPLFINEIAKKIKNSIYKFKHIQS